MNIPAYLNKPKEINALKRIRLQKEMVLIKLKEQAIISNNQNKLKDVIIEKNEYDQYLVKLYLYRNKKLPDSNVQSLESTLLSTIDITHEDFIALSLKRMVNVRNLLIDKYQISSDRIFLGERDVAINKALKNSASQIILKLK